MPKLSKTNARNSRRIRSEARPSKQMSSIFVQHAQLDFKSELLFCQVLMGHQTFLVAQRIRVIE